MKQLGVRDENYEAQSAEHMGPPQNHMGVSQRIHAHAGEQERHGPSTGEQMYGFMGLAGSVSVA